jgi:hypothetical protein
MLSDYDYCDQRDIERIGWSKTRAANRTAGRNNAMHGAAPVVGGDGQPASRAIDAGWIFAGLVIAVMVTAQCIKTDEAKGGFWRAARSGDRLGDRRPTASSVAEQASILGAMLGATLRKAQKSTRYLR